MSERNPDRRKALPDAIQPRGRGARSNVSGRFEPNGYEPFDDGWREDDGDPPKLHTRIHAEHPKRIISRNNSPDIPFDQSINPYKGCEHGCIYCYARPSHAFLGLSPGLDFETKIFYKPNAASLLDKALRAKGYRARPIALGANTDPYQPIERTARATRSILEVLARFNHPVGIITKSALVLRDLDILAPMAARVLAHDGFFGDRLSGKFPGDPTLPHHQNAIGQADDLLHLG